MLGLTSSQTRYKPRSALQLSLPRAFFALTLLVNLVYWTAEAVVDLRSTGFFYFLGVDWSRFWGAAHTFVTSGPRAAYRLDTIAQSMQPFAGYYASGSSFGLAAHGLRVGPSPYPPIFLAAFSVFTVPPLPVGFLLWTALNALLAAWVIWRLTADLPARVRWPLFVLLVLSYPLMIELYVGQLVILLLAGVYLAYRDFERERDFRAGLWLGLLVLKPQYLPVLALVLLFKRRWTSLAGVAVSGLAILFSSLAVGGLGGMVGYVRMILLDYPSYTGGMAIDPHSMITWRALVFDLFPELGSTVGLFLTASLSLLSLVALIPIWRGDWNACVPRFHAQMLATMIVTQLVAYHSHLHGAVLLIVPAMLLVAAGEASREIQWLMAAALLGPPFAGGLSVLLFRDLRLIGVLYIVVMVLGLIWLLLDQPELTLNEPARA